MGIICSINRFLGCKTEDEEEGERPIYSYLLYRKQNHYNPYGNSSGSSETSLPKTFIFCSLIYNAVKGLLRFVTYLRRPSKTTDPVLPIQNPASSITTEPLLVQNTLISSPTNSSSEVIPDSIEKEEEEEKVSIKSTIILVSNERWIKHYSSRHRILLVGDGDFSFSASLALAFGYASNIIATSLDSEAFLKKNYLRASSNIENLRRRDSKVMHEIDATKMANHPSLKYLKFDRIIFNFPYAGLSIKNLPRESQLRSHRRLVDQFLKNAREMISENGEIHISHKSNGFHVEFKLESAALSHRLRLIEAVKFNYLDYPGYNTKCGFGGNNNFNCNPSKTYKFGLKSPRC